jgi:hypothetical protein
LNIITFFQHNFRRYKFKKPGGSLSLAKPKLPGTILPGSIQSAFNQASSNSAVTAGTQASTQRTFPADGNQAGRLVDDDDVMVVSQSKPFQQKIGFFKQETSKPKKVRLAFHSSVMHDPYPACVRVRVRNFLLTKDIVGYIPYVCIRSTFVSVSLAFGSICEIARTWTYPGSTL